MKMHTHNKKQRSVCCLKIPTTIISTIRRDEAKPVTKLKKGTKSLVLQTTLW